MVKNLVKLGAAAFVSASMIASQGALCPGLSVVYAAVEVTEELTGELPAATGEGAEEAPDELKGGLPGAAEEGTEESAESASELAEEEITQAEETGDEVYLLDTVKPYLTEGDYAEEESISMGGLVYGHGFTYHVDEEGSTVFFNLEGRYMTLSFAAGVVSASKGESFIVTVSGDGEELLKMELAYGDLPSDAEIDVVGCSQLTIDARSNQSNPDTRLGFAEMILFGGNDSRRNELAGSGEDKTGNQDADVNGTPDADGNSDSPKEDEGTDGIGTLIDAALQDAMSFINEVEKGLDQTENEVDVPGPEGSGQDTDEDAPGTEGTDQDTAETERPYMISDMGAWKVTYVGGEGLDELALEYGGFWSNSYDEGPNFAYSGFYYGDYLKTIEDDREYYEEEYGSNWGYDMGDIRYFTTDDGRGGAYFIYHQKEGNLYADVALDLDEEESFYFCISNYYTEEMPEELILAYANAFTFESKT